MTAAVDNWGNLWATYLQSNGNSMTTLLILEQLVEQLEAESSNWRSKTIIAMDGAAYH